MIQTTGKPALCQTATWLKGVKIYQINTHHVVQADTPAFKQNLTRESVYKCEPDLKGGRKKSHEDGVKH